MLYSNFVESIDGVATLGEGEAGIHAGSAISGRNPGDRFLMALLRACADAVLLGAGTLRATPGHVWTPAAVFPSLAESFAGLRRSLGRGVEPRLALITSSGNIDVSHPAVQHGATILTTAAGAEALSGRLSERCDVAVLGEGLHVDVARAVEELRNRGHTAVLTEGGPHLMADLINAKLLDEAFLTISPVFAGRDRTERMGMVQGVELLPGSGAWSRLISARRHGDHLFLRYGLSHR